MESCRHFVPREIDNTEDVPSVPGAFHVKEPAIEIDSQVGSQCSSHQGPSYNPQALSRIIKAMFPSITKERIEYEFGTGRSPAVILNDLAEESSSFSV